MCTDTPQRYLRRILVSDLKQTKRWPIIPSLRRCQCSPPPAYLSMCTDTPQRYLRRILILDFKQKNAGRPFSFQNRFSLLWQPCSLYKLHHCCQCMTVFAANLFGRHFAVCTGQTGIDKTPRGEDCYSRVDKASISISDRASDITFYRFDSSVLWF